MKECKKEHEKEKELTAMTITHIATELAAVSEKNKLFYSKTNRQI
ncbi:hypothetical protein ACT7DC_31490 [Bacillus cereus]